MSRAPRPLRVGLVGCGHIAPFHVDAWLRSRGAVLTCVCDRVASRAAALAPSGASIYRDLGRMLAEEELDVLDIAASSEAHLEMVRMAAARGVHVLCQKPLGDTVAEAKAASRACARAGTRLMVMEVARFLPWIAAIVERLPRVGPPRVLRYRGERDPMRVRALFSGQPYLRRQARLIVKERISHAIDVARLLLGDADSVYCSAARFDPSLAGEHDAVLVVEHRSGSRSIHDFSWTRSAGRERWSDGEILLEGDRGALHFRLGQGDLRWIGRAVKTIGSFDFGEGFRLGFHRAIDSFLAAIQGGIPFEYEPADHIATLEVVAAAYASIESRRPERCRR